VTVSRGSGRHRAPRRLSRRVAVPAAMGAVLLAAVVATTVAADPAPVRGTPSAAEAAVPERPVQRALAGATPSPLPPPAPPPTSAAPPPPPPPAPVTPEAPPPQAANTVRLAHGGTATLVRKEVVDGVLPIPDGIREATWWGAAFDGTTGATVLAGHVNWRGATGPFAELWTAKLGDQVTVVDGNGVVHQYQVRQLVTVHKNDLPQRAQELFGQDGNHRLVLVTCGGRWVGGRDGYEENRIVIAD
jgi:LPXTG-site transpeptidase (sortase) family protein